MMLIGRGHTVYIDNKSFDYNGQTYTLQYSGGSWQLTQDPAYHLDESTCNTMRSTPIEVSTT